jgi:hypothetical protein
MFLQNIAKTTFFSFALVGFVALAQAEEKYKVDYEKGIIQAYGYACSKPNTPRLLAKIQAREAARVVALKNLAEAINNVKVVGFSSIKDMQFDKSEYGTFVNSLIKGAIRCPDKPYNFEYDPEARQGCVENYCLMIRVADTPQGAKLLLPIIEKLKKEYPTKPPKVEEIAPKKEKVEQVVSRPQLQQIDGVIIDVREIPDYSPSLAPIVETKDIANRPKIVFAASMVNEDVVRRKGTVAAHVTTKPQLDSVLQSWNVRHPLIIKAKSVDPATGAIVISNEDAVKLIAADQKNNFLSKGNVIIWMSPTVSQTSLSY